MGGSWLSLVQTRKRNASQLTVKLAGPWPRGHLSAPVSTPPPTAPRPDPRPPQAQRPNPTPYVQRFTGSDGREQPGSGTSPRPRAAGHGGKVTNTRKGPADTSPEEPSLYFLAQARELATSPPKAPVQHISECPACLSNGEAKGLKRRLKLNCLRVPIRKTLLWMCIWSPVIYPITKLHHSPRVLFIIVVLFSYPVVSNSLRPHGLEPARPPCPSPSPELCPQFMSIRSCDVIQPSHPLMS